MNSKGKIPPNKNQIEHQNLPKEPYTEVCKFEETDNVTLFTKKNYNIAISSGMTTLRISSVNLVFDTGTGPNMLQEGLVETDFLPSVHLCDSLQLKSETKPKVEVVGTIVLQVRIGESRIRVIMFGIVRNLRASVLLCSSFIDQFIKSLFRSVKRQSRSTIHRCQSLLWMIWKPTRQKSHEKSPSPHNSWAELYLRASTSCTSYNTQAVIRNVFLSRNKLKRHCTALCLYAV